MKYTVVILALLVGNLSLSAQIQREPALSGKKDTIAFTASDGKKDKQSRKERFKELDLTKEQRGKMKEINQSGKAAKEAIENNTQLSEEEKNKQLRNLKREQAQKIQAILTPEQREKLKASRQDNS